MSLLLFINTSWALSGGSFVRYTLSTPPIVLLQYKSTVCTGSLIEDRWVLTAAHCLDQPMKPYVTHAATRKKIELKIQSQVAHPNFHLSRIENSTLFKSGNWSQHNESSLFDVAVIELQPESTELLQRLKIKGFSKDQLISNLSLPDIFQVQVYGYGRYNENGDSGVLKTKNFQLNNLFNSFYFTDDVGIRGGDSGGPLIYEQNLVGLNAALTWNFDSHQIVTNEFTNLRMQENQDFLYSALQDMPSEHHYTCQRIEDYKKILFERSRQEIKEFGRFLLEEPIERVCFVSKKVCQTPCQ